MCLILAAPAGKKVPSSWINNAADHNPHGVGVMAARSGRIYIHRSVDVKQSQKIISSFNRNENVFVHWRFATHGERNKQNCHPFMICGGRYAVMHNGILSVPTDKYPRRSDTYHFCKMVLEPWFLERPGDFEDDRFIIDLGGVIGENNKLLLLRSDGEFRIVNERQGSWDNGFWLSNHYSINPPPSALYRGSRRANHAHLYDNHELGCYDLDAYERYACMQRHQQKPIAALPAPDSDDDLDIMDAEPCDADPMPDLEEMASMTEESLVELIWARTRDSAREIIDYFRPAGRGSYWRNDAR